MGNCKCMRVVAVPQQVLLQMLRLGLVRIQSDLADRLMTQLLHMLRAYDCLPLQDSRRFSSSSEW